MVIVRVRSSRVALSMNAITQKPLFCLPGPLRALIGLWHLRSVSFILALTGLAKAWSGLGHTRVLAVPDPVTGISFGHLMLAVGVVELVIASVCLFGKSQMLKLGLVAWLATNFVAYRLGLWWMGWKKPCSCLGNLTDALHLSPQAADNIMKVILAYLLIGSYGLLLWQWRHVLRRPTASCWAGSHVDRVGTWLILLISLLGALELEASDAIQFHASGKIKVDVFSEPPHLNFPKGQSTIAFEVTRYSNAWHMRFDIPASYAGTEQQLNYYGSLGGDLFSVATIGSMGISNSAKNHSVAGVARKLNPLQAYSSSAVIFLVWYVYLSDQAAVEMVPALFYDHRANSFPSNGQCVVSVRGKADNLVTEAIFSEAVDDTGRKKSSAIYKALNTTEFNGCSVVSAFALESKIRIPIVFGDKMLLEGSWVDAVEGRGLYKDEKLVLGSRLNAVVERIELPPETIAIPPPLDLQQQYQFLDMRFGNSRSEYVLYSTNRWLEDSEVRSLHEKRQAALGKQPDQVPEHKSFPKSRVRAVIAIAASLSALGIFWLTYSARKQPKLNNHISES